ncbi:hypothetical protein [Flavobacterium praedii]|uniref:hypothetical protein n=1 Tax=Flavobacterium praedii TaxID=3002900 RepID=UPI002481C38B|nr:hypothetical protein [Flavobacterium praedii]
MEKKEISVSVLKSIFGAIPYGGALLDELFFEYNGRLKQNRLNKFIEILAENFTENTEIDLNNIKTEDFSDLFESILRRVVQTKSELKLLRFKDILIAELKKPSESIELIDHYLDLISNLTEEEITILYNHRFFTTKYEEEIDAMNLLKGNLHSLENQLEKESIIIGESEIRKQHDDIKAEYEKKREYILSFGKFKKADFYNLPENKFMFYKQRLFSKGLLIDNPMSRIGSLPFWHMGITEFGTEFINFIKNRQ